MSHYEVLGIKPHSSRHEIKTAYYELVKIHHPDVNEGCDE